MRVGIAFDLNGAKHVRLYDLVIRGANKTTLNVEKCQNVELDGLTVYGGSPAVLFRASSDLKLTRSCVRGISAPWSWRGGQKYRGNSAYVMIARPEEGGGFGKRLLEGRSARVVVTMGMPAFFYRLWFLSHG